MTSSSSIISSMITSFLGPCKSYKYVVQDSETHTVKCPHQLLQVAVTSDHFSYIIEAALADHHQKFYCSTMSFLAMWYFWNQEFRSILHEIIKGSITYEYVHLGYHSNFTVTVKKTPEELDISNKEIWFQNCCDLLTELQINVLLVHGNVDVDIAAFCASHSILLISSVPWSAVEIICLTLKIYPCTYLLDCDIKNIVKNLIVRKWQPAFEKTWNTDIFFQIDMNPDISIKPSTIILCHPNPSFLVCLEHQLMHFISRLSLATSNNKVLPGGGKTEEWCYQIMMKNIKGTSPKIKVRSAIASGFRKYFETVNQKIEMKGTLFDEALDEMTSKIEAWKSALSLNMMTLQCDSVLINDPDNIVVEELDLDLLGYL